MPVNSIPGMEWSSPGTRPAETGLGGSLNRVISIMLLLEIPKFEAKGGPNDTDFQRLQDTWLKAADAVDAVLNGEEPYDGYLSDLVHGMAVLNFIPGIAAKMQLETSWLDFCCNYVREPIPTAAAADTEPNSPTLDIHATPEPQSEDPQAA